jgi:tripartite-type tricarboxylate transporter receptor subunit TctC
VTSRDKSSRVTLSRRKFHAGLTAAALLPQSAFAAYPERAIRLIVPFAAGGAVDAVARVLGKALSSNLGASVVIDNRGGAGGIVGMEAAAHASPDGYTLLLSHSGFAAMPGLYRDLPFDSARDFTGVITAASGAYVLVVNARAPFASTAALVAFAKSHPGQVTYASAGAGSTIHLASEFFKRQAGIDLLHVPYKGAAPAMTDLLGGQVDMMFAPAVASLPLAAAGKLKALAVTSAKRSALAPEAADGRGERPARIRSLRLVWPRRAGCDAGRRSDAAQCRDQSRARIGSCDRRVARSGPRAGRRHAGRGDGVDRRRGRALDRDHPRRRHQAAVRHSQ